MSRTASDGVVDGPGGFPVSPAQAYFLAIERLFLELRGAPLTLGPADWQKAREWQEAGVPLDLVLSTLREAFERRRDKDQDDKVWALAQCGRAVRAAWKRHLALNAASRAGGAPEAEAPLAERLARLAAALPAEATALRPRVVALAAEDDEEAVEEALVALDAEALALVLASLSADEHAEIDAELARSRRALAERLPSLELQAAERELRDRLVRRRRRLPVLSLFALEASPPG